MPAIDTTRNFDALPEGDVQFTGASGDGNDPARADLERGYSDAGSQPMSPLEMFLTNGNVDQSGPARYGFLGRATGWER